MPVTVPRRRLSTPGDLDELERDAQHRVQVGYGDFLFGRMHVRHAVCEVDAGQPARVEDIRVRPTPDLHRSRSEPGPLERGDGESEGGIVGAEAVTAVSL